MKVIHLHQQEKDIIAQAISNNRQAQQHLYTTYAPKMLGVCRQYIKDLHHAEDVMISAFMKVFTNLKKFENKGSFEGWIRKTMVNECIDFLRVKKNTFKHDNIDEINVSGGDDFEISEFTTDAIQLLIDNLPNGYKVVFNLYAIEGYKHHEIATLLNINEGTSKSQLSQARKMLQNQINELKLKEYGTR